MSIVKVDTYLGIDPGSNTGIAILYAEGDRVVKVETQTLNLKSHFLERAYEQDEMKKLVRYRTLKKYLINLFNRIHPTSIGREDAFSAQYAQAYAELTRLVLMIDFAHYDYDPTLPYYKFAPKLVKSVFSMNGNANKDDMREALKKHSVLKKYYMEELSEHEIDALAIAYITFLRNQEHFNVKEL